MWNNKHEIYNTHLHTHLFLNVEVFGEAREKENMLEILKMHGSWHPSPV